jgi:hypothetical protein
MWTYPGNTYIGQRHMNVEIGTEAAPFTEKEYINGIFLAVYWRHTYADPAQFVRFYTMVNLRYIYRRRSTGRHICAAHHAEPAQRRVPAIGRLG